MLQESEGPFELASGKLSETSGESVGDRAGVGEARKGIGRVKAWQGWGFDRVNVHSLSIFYARCIPYPLGLCVYVATIC